MASGDTISGSVRIVLEDTQGNRNVVLGSLPQGKLDYTNQTVSPDEKTYVNTGRSARVTAPAGAQTRNAPDAVFESGERLIIQHKSNADNNLDIDLTFDAFDIEGVSKDLNRDNAFIEVLAQAQQELSGTVAQDDSEFVDIYQYTVPDRTRFFLAGSLEAIAIEN